MLYQQLGAVLAAGLLKVEEMEALAGVLDTEHYQAALRHRGKVLRVEAQQTPDRHIILAQVVAAQEQRGKA
jgi:hypothetical protein